MFISHELHCLAYLVSVESRFYRYMASWFYWIDFIARPRIQFYVFLTNFPTFLRRWHQDPVEATMQIRRNAVFSLCYPTNVRASALRKLEMRGRRLIIDNFYLMVIVMQSPFSMAASLTNEGHPIFYSFNSPIICQ